MYVTLSPSVCNVVKAHFTNKKSNNEGEAEQRNQFKRGESNIVSNASNIYRKRDDAVTQIVLLLAAIKKSSCKLKLGMHQLQTPIDQAQETKRGNISAYTGTWMLHS